MNEEPQIELKGSAVQEILCRSPRWIIRWGISIIFICFVFALCLV